MTHEQTSTLSRDAEIAWAAGLFEGEGCFSHRLQRNGNAQVRVALAMTDRDAVERFAAFVGVGEVHGPKANPKQPGWRPVWEWYVQDSARVRAVIALLLPWLCERRRAKALEVDAIAAGILPQGEARTHCRRGHPYSGDNVTVEPNPKTGGTARRCRTCRRDQSRERARKRLGIRPENYRVT